MQDRHCGAMLAIAFALTTVVALTVGAGTAASKPHCVAADTQDLTPTLTAPDWYDARKTKLCEKPDLGDGDVFVVETVNWTYYATPQGSDRWRSNPDNADYSAKDCETSFRWCGNRIIGALFGKPRSPIYAAFRLRWGTAWPPHRSRGRNCAHRLRVAI